MALSIVTLVLGPLANNVYLIADTDTEEAAVIDPAVHSPAVLKEAQQRNWRITRIWITHAHFDHIAGAEKLASAFNPRLPVGLHAADLPLWRAGGGAPDFGFDMDAGREPEMPFYHEQRLTLGGVSFQVRHTPGHTPGHVIFYCAEAGVAFCGDVIFYHGVGRSDLAHSDPDALLQSIRTQVLTLPPYTRLLSGHGSATTVQEELDHNPFV